MATISPFRYPGSKNKMLPIIMEYLKPLLYNSHKFCEPFVGGGSVALEVAQQYPNKQLFISDKNRGISNFWKIVSDVNDKNLIELLCLMRQLPTIEQFYKLREEGKTLLSEARSAYHAIFFNRTTFSGILNSGPIGGAEQKSKYTVNCRYNFEKLRDKILKCRSLLIGRTFVSNSDFADYDILNTDYPTYLDPPYRIKGETLYPDFMKPIEHERLASILDKRSNWVLSYDDCLEIRNLYSNKTIIDLAARYCINGTKENWKNKNELIILS